MVSPRSSATRRSDSIAAKPCEDVGRTLAETYAICAMRVREHAVFERIRSATDDRMSLINLLSNVAHPTQAIADVLTLAERFSGGDVTKLAGLEVAYVGDATNVDSFAGGRTASTRGQRDGGRARGLPVVGGHRRGSARGARGVVRCA